METNHILESSYRKKPANKPAMNARSIKGLGKQQALERTVSSNIARCFLPVAVSWLLACPVRSAEPVLKVPLTADTMLELVLVRAGDFDQGAADEEPGRGGDETRRHVRITRDFYIGRTSVTRGQWRTFVAETGYRSEAEQGGSGGFGWDGSALVQKKQYTWRDPGFSQTDNHPVCLVTWPDAQAFCTWLEKKMMRKTMLPTEAQWEYACRAGTTTAWHTGSNADACDRAAWHKGNSGNGTRPVDSKEPNAWGLFIGGNVSEWCLDLYASYQVGPVNDPCQNAPNPGDKPRRVLRGGSWLRDEKNTRSAARYRADPRSRNADIGFRVVCAVDAEPTPIATSPVMRENPKHHLVAEEETQPQTPATGPPADEIDRTVTDPMQVAPSSFTNKGVSLVGIVGSLLCLAVPILILVKLIKTISGQKSMTAVSVMEPHAAPVPHQQIRKVTDGFWINGNWPVGTPLRLSYMAGGLSSTQDLIYRPGPEGQFFFTGSVPDSVSVVPAVGGGSTMNPPLFNSPPAFPVHHVDRTSDAPRPPVFPSAY